LNEIRGKIILKNKGERINFPKRGQIGGKLKIQSQRLKKIIRNFGGGNIHFCDSEIEIFLKEGGI